MTINNAFDSSRPLRADADRLWMTLMEISTFGETVNKGLDRLTLSAADFEARNYLIGLARERGYGISVDDIGNLFIARTGSDPTLAPILVGSHIDSQPSGGRFDGTYGVIGAFEALRALDDSGVQTLRSIVLADWTNEEGARFSPSMLGSLVFAGHLALEEALGVQDAEGTSVRQALAVWQPDLPDSEYRLADFAAAFELHIEQGPLLEDTETDIGVVTGVQGIRWVDVVVTGKGGHAGTTPHIRRHDALAAASELVLAVDSLPPAVSAELRATAGQLRIHPGSRNSIPGRVTIEIDLRHPEATALDRAINLLSEAAKGVSERRGVKVQINERLRQSPILFDDGTLAHVSSAITSLGLTSTPMASGAGHDAMQLAQHIPTAMVFIPCVDGISHDEAEDIRPEWAINGVNVLLNALVEAANQ